MSEAAGVGRDPGTLSPAPILKGFFFKKPWARAMTLKPQSFVIHIPAKHELIPSVYLKPVLFHINVLPIEINTINTDQGY